MPAVENTIVTATVSMPTPVTAAPGLSPSLRAEAARCAATSDDEQAVSVVKHGPVSPSVYDRRPDTTERASALAEDTDSADGEAPPPPLAPVLPPAPRKKPTGALASADRRLDPLRNTP
jgi:hypothetical protein